MTGALQFCLWLALGLLLGMVAAGIEGGELVKETALGGGGGIIGGILYTLIGGQRHGIRPWVWASGRCDRSAAGRRSAGGPRDLVANLMATMKRSGAGLPAAVIMTIVASTHRR